MELINESKDNCQICTYRGITLLRLLGIAWEQNQLALVNLEPLAVELERLD